MIYEILMICSGGPRLGMDIADIWQNINTTKNKNKSILALFSIYTGILSDYFIERIIPTLNNDVLPHNP